MNRQEFIEAIQKDYLDEFGLVKPHKADGTCNNGVLYTSIAQIISDSDIGEEAVQRCYIVPGLLNRKPGTILAQQEQFDDLLGRIVRCIQKGDTKEPRAILLYGLKHGFVYDTDNHLEGKDFLIRFWFVFALLFAAAFPMLKRLVQPALTFYINGFKCDSLSDTSALQLEWLVCKGYDLLYPSKKTVEFWWKVKLWLNTDNCLADVFFIYYEPTHPFTQYTWDNE